MSFTTYQEAMSSLLEASIAHHKAESAVFGAQRSGRKPTREEMHALDLASAELRAKSRIYASQYHKLIADQEIARH